MDFIGVMGIWTNSTLFLDTLYLQIWGRRGGWGRGAASPCSCRRTWRTTSWRRHCSPPVTPRPRTGDTVAGFTTCYLSTVYCSAQVINILDFSFRDCGLKQKAGLYYGQMARQELNCTRLLMNSVSNAHYYIVVLITITSPYLYTWCGVSRVTCSRAELRIPTERGAGGDWAGTLEGRHGECGPCAAHCMQSHTSIISIFTLNFKMLHIFRLTILFKLLHSKFVTCLQKNLNFGWS